MYTDCTQGTSSVVLSAVSVVGIESLLDEEMMIAVSPLFSGRLVPLCKQWIRGNIR